MTEAKKAEYNYKHEYLMDRWIAKLGAGDGIRTFAKDGIIDPEKWFARDDDKYERILFLLKESYEQDDTKEGDAKHPKRISDIAKWLRHEQCISTKMCSNLKNDPNACKTCHISGKTYNALALLTCGIDAYCDDNELPFDVADTKFRENREEYWHNIAIVNVKKPDGEKQSEDNDLYFHAVRDQIFIKEQIALIAPTLIICCGTYDILRCIYANEKDINFLSNTPCRVGKLGKINIIETRHPIFANYNDFYTTIMTSYKELKRIHT